MPAERTRQIERLEQVAADYDVVLCDVWGVLHNGERPFPFAVEALQAWREAGKSVVLITNSPRPADGVIRQFDIIGVPKNAWDDIVTSGDVTRRLVEQGPKKLFLIGPDRDHALVDGIDVELVEEGEADAILCTGLYDDEVETPDDYAELLARLVDRKLPFICANPDQVVERGDRLIYCAGSLATVYEKLGGETRIAGKPHSPIYAEALRRVERIRGSVPDNRVLAIGDGIMTDIRGAIGAELDALFIARGIHAAEYYTGNKLDETRLAAFFEREETRPTIWAHWLG
jgi:HAD superfamily hydrolase (TIGR01459 family)